MLLLENNKIQDSMTRKSTPKIKNKHQEEYFVLVQVDLHFANSAIVLEL